jgi:hypothetical protein
MAAVRDGHTSDRAMNRAVGWALIVAFVLLLGTHPGSLAALGHDFLTVLGRAGNELSSFVSRL